MKTPYLKQISPTTWQIRQRTFWPFYRTLGSVDYVSIFTSPYRVRLKTGLCYGVRELEQVLPAFQALTDI